ncbi:hypothetical protein L208DRAFT_1342234, partial [Tricholoma matsutake]
PPAYPYLCSLSCYSALVELYACSGQLPTAMRLHSQHKINSYQCHFGCHDALEDEHHLFVECPYFAELWSFSLSVILEYTELKCHDLVEKCLLPSEIVQCLMSAAKSLFSDDGAIWPLHHTAFYLGQIPDIFKLLEFEQHTLHSSLHPSIQLSHDLHSIVLEWHTQSIRLASRIWGQVQRVTASGAGF